MLVVFLVSSAVPQLARYSAKIADGAMQLAAEAEDAGDVHSAVEARSRAEAALVTALSFAQAEFQLHHDLGLCHMGAGDDLKARRSFQRAAELYPACPRPHFALALLLQRFGRPPIS